MSLLGIGACQGDHWSSACDVTAVDRIRRLQCAANAQQPILAAALASQLGSWGQHGPHCKTHSWALNHRHAAASSRSKPGRVSACHLRRCMRGTGVT
jgi:hypothetical protein